MDTGGHLEVLLHLVNFPYGVAYGGGRADVRLSEGGDGEIYVLSKSDGFIRKMVAVVAPPPATKTIATR